MVQIGQGCGPQPGVSLKRGYCARERKATVFLGSFGRGTQTYLLIGKIMLWTRTYCGRHSARSAWIGEMELARNAGTSAAISADRASATIATETITGSY